MDDSFENPSPLSAPKDADDVDEERSSGEEDIGLDWTRMSFGIHRPTIPKRGEKEFEPTNGGGSRLQAHVLERTRSAMFGALRTTPTSSSKNISYAIWYPELARAHVTLARGIHFASMGHSMPRPVPHGSALQKRLELLPEEAVYLIERGALLCWKESNISITNTPGMEDINGSPMSVQQAYAEMIGREGLTLEHYQVFAYLKRLGYSVIRARPPSSHYPIPSPTIIKGSSLSVLSRIMQFFSRMTTRFWNILCDQVDWWRPIRIHRWLHHNKSYGSIFKSLRFIPSGHQVPLYTVPRTETSPYHYFFHIYKPSAPFRKTSPPPPDFSICVVNARTTPMPSFHELTSLFETQPDVPPTLPRQRRPPPPSKAPPPPSRGIFSFAFWRPTTAIPMQKPNPFVALKAGKKTAVIAAVDSGNISFFRFAQGAFEEWPMV